MVTFGAEASSASTSAALYRPHLREAWKCEASQGLMCISNTKSAREETQGWAAIYWRFTRPHETAHPFFYLICPRLKRMALCTGDGHLESSSNKSRCLKSRADRKHHVGESPCSGRRTSNLEIWECRGCFGHSRRLPLDFHLCSKSFGEACLPEEVSKTPGKGRCLHRAAWSVQGCFRVLQELHFGKLLPKP